MTNDVNEGLKHYEYMSRYTAVDVWYDVVNRVRYHGRTKGLDMNGVLFTLHKVRENDTYWSIATEFYGSPTYAWVVADCNNVMNMFEKPKVGSELKIIALTAIKFK